MFRIKTITAIGLFTIMGLAECWAGSVSASTSDPQAVAFATQSMQSLTEGNNVADVTLTGTATETIGPETDSETVTLRALGYANSRVDFGSSGRSEVITVDAANHPLGEWITADGKTHLMAFHNVWHDAVWFFPAFSALSLTSQTGVIAKYVGEETRNGESVQHLQFHFSN